MLALYSVAVAAMLFSGPERVWQTGRITRADQPERKKPEPYEVWNPWLTHWYTIESASTIVKATELVPAAVRGGTNPKIDRDPLMSFRPSEEVRFSLGDPPTKPRQKREVYVLDRKGKEHTLTVDAIIPKPD